MAGDDGGGWYRSPQSASEDPGRALWPWVFPVGSRHVPVVGPTEALRGRSAGPAMPVPEGAVPGLLDPAQRSSWQLAQEVWQESGVAWEHTTPELTEVRPAYLEPAGPEDVDPGDYVDERRAPEAWPRDADLSGSEPDAPAGDGFDPAAGDAWPADTWFTGIGPADTRFAGARPAGDEPTAQRAAAEDSGPYFTGPYFADSGVAPAQPEFPSRDHRRQPGHGPRPGPVWNDYPPGGFPGQAWPAGSAALPLGAPVALDPQAADTVGLAEPFGTAGIDGLAGPDGAPAARWAGGTSLSEPDELFRAWQGSVNEATAGRGPWAVPRRAASASRRRRAVQAAAIGVPVAVIVTVGAGALMILTGRANEMLAVRADTGAVSPAAAGSTGAQAGTQAGALPTAGSVPPAFVSAALSGYPGQRGAVTVTSMTTAAGMTLAAGTADGHPAIWRRASNGSWTLESATSLGAMAGSAGLTAVADGPAGWIAVGATSNGKSTAPVVLASADGERWQPVASLVAAAGAGTEFLGVAASRSGYVAVGRQMVGGRTFAVLWYSADLRTWTSDNNDGLDGRLEASTVNAVVATAGGFVAVGSHGAVQALWVSSDGRHWRMDSVSPPAGTASATLRSVAASGARVVAGGYAATRGGDVPVAVVSTDGGAQWRQVVLATPNGVGMVTALTAIPDGFTAAGVVGSGGSQRTVTWTSPDGLTWSRPVQTTDSEITALAPAGTTVMGAEQGAAPTLVALPAP
jgi:hypothetical protein